MYDLLSTESGHTRRSLPSLDSVALYGRTPTAYHLARLFSSAGLHVYLVPLSNDDSSRLSTSNNFTIVDDPHELPYLSSVLINCQNYYTPIRNLLSCFPVEYRRKMAYVECSSHMRINQLETIHDQIKHAHYLCMGIVEMETSTIIQPHFHFICSGDHLVFQALLVQTHISAKISFLTKTKTSFDAHIICLLHQYSQVIHLAIYAEMMGILHAANEKFPGNLQFLFDWSYLKRPLMRQMILQSSSPFFLLSTINDLQEILECIIDLLFTREENIINDKMKGFTRVLYKFILNLDSKQKQKPLFDLFTMY